MINTMDLAGYLEKIYDFQMSDPDVAWCPMLLGAPGIGKTHFVEQLARRKDVRVFHLILSQANPSEVCGMVMPGPNNTTQIFDPQWASDLKDGDILFLDEVLKAPKATLNSCLTMIEERRLSSGTKLPKVAMFAAANPTKTMNQLEPEIKQRLVAVEITWSGQAWKEWLAQDLSLNIEKGDLNSTLNALVNQILSQLDHCTEWNALTPRSAYKMIRFAKQAGADVAKDMINSMFFGENKVRLFAFIDAMEESSKLSVQEQILQKIGPQLSDMEYNGLAINVENKVMFATALQELLVSNEELAELFKDITVQMEAI